MLCLGCGLALSTYDDVWVASENIRFGVCDCVFVARSKVVFRGV